MTTLVCLSCGEVYKTREWKPQMDEARCQCGGLRDTPGKAKRRNRIPAKSKKRQAEEESGARSKQRPRKAMRRTEPKRDWTDARAKVEEEACCRICKRSEASDRPLEAAHVLGREHDEPKLGADGWPLKELYVDPERIFPACGPSPSGCHGEAERNEINVLSVLSLSEQIKAVEDAGGIEAARIRLAPVDHRDEVERDSVAA